MITERTEDYLEAIHSISLQKGYAKVKDIAELLHVAPPTVTEMFKKMQKEGFIFYERYSGVTLTEKGKTVAIKTQKKHDTLVQFLRILGISEEVADQDACRIEHVVNKETMKRLTAFVEFVQQSEEMPNWLQRFNKYYQKG
ncbi:MAG: metal-dependent transcriptional regulator [Candidatus Thermoplasmatota archaeon]|nr:metal-dependent transcriptional regulator [Candidatus Thermoplasmatota archaeon]